MKFIVMKYNDIFIGRSKIHNWFYSMCDGEHGSWWLNDESAKHSSKISPEFNVLYYDIENEYYHNEYTK